MPRWIEFTSHYDHRWPTGSVTAFDKGMVVNVKNEVADAAIGVKAAKASKKPKVSGEDGHVTTPTRMESARRVRGGLLRVAGEVKTGGHGFTKSGDPITPQGTVLPDAADPAALRAEPLIERDRARVTVGVQSEATDEEAESESQVEATDEVSAGDGATGEGEKDA